MFWNVYKLMWANTSSAVQLLQNELICLYYTNEEGHNLADINNVVIGDNRVKFYNEILKISNISRTWIFRFQNVEKI